MKGVVVPIFALVVSILVPSTTSPKLTAFAQMTLHVRK